MVKVVYLDLSKAFNTHCCKILREKLIKCGLDKWRVGWIEKWLNCLAQQAVISSMKYYWRPIISGVNTESDPGTSGAVQPAEGKAQRRDPINEHRYLRGGVSKEPDFSVVSSDGTRVNGQTDIMEISCKCQKKFL